MIDFIARFEHNDELIKKIQWLGDKLETFDKDDEERFNKVFFARMGRTKLKNPKSIDKLALYNKVLGEKSINDFEQLVEIVAELEFGLDFTISPELADYVNKKVKLIAKK
jgi:hypothetical protein